MNLYLPNWQKEEDTNCEMDKQYDARPWCPCIGFHLRLSIRHSCDNLQPWSMAVELVEWLWYLFWRAANDPTSVYTFQSMGVSKRNDSSHASQNDPVARQISTGWIRGNASNIANKIGDVIVNVANLFSVCQRHAKKDIPTTVCMVTQHNMKGKAAGTMTHKGRKQWRQRNSAHAIQDEKGYCACKFTAGAEPPKLKKKKPGLRSQNNYPGAQRAVATHGNWQKIDACPWLLLLPRNP